MFDLSSLGWNEHFQSSLQQLDNPDLRPARVAVAHKSQFELIGCDTPRAELSGRFLHQAGERPAVGDWVAVADGRIHALLPRVTGLVRQAAGLQTAAQVIAANIDIVFVVASLNRDFNPRRIERYLTAIWASGARPVIVLNKADLCPEWGELIGELGPVAAGVPCCVASAHTGMGMDELRRHMGRGITVALAGSSGVGKSSLINRLAGRALLRTGDIRGDDDKGRHTTTHRELVVLGEDGLLIDTPGMRELQLWDAEEGNREAFGEVEALARQCRFRDCSHQGEPGCAVRDHVPAHKLDHYAKLRREQEYQDRRRDAAARHETKKRWKQITVGMRARKRVDAKLRRD